MADFSQSDFKSNIRADLFIKKEKKYLEILYIQIMRNSKSDNFDKSCLLNFLCLSEYLNSKIFSALSKDNKQTLKLEEFTSGISLLFSLYFQIKGEKLITSIFNMISNNSDSITSYKAISEFINNLLFDCMCKASRYEYDFFIILASNLSALVKKAFQIGKHNTKLTQFTYRDFCRMIEKSPVLVNIIILMLNMLSPINDKLIDKFIDQKEFEIFENDDFEDESEFKQEQEDETPIINSLPAKENFFDLDFLKRNFESDSNYNNNKNYASNCHSNNFAYHDDSFLNNCTNSDFTKIQNNSRNDSNSSI